MTRNASDLHGDPAEIVVARLGVDELLFRAIGDRPAWMCDAACREHPEIDWVPSAGAPSRRARQICEPCLVRVECLAFGVEHDAEGWWGATTARERRRRAAATAVDGVGTADTPASVRGAA